MPTGVAEWSGAALLAFAVFSAVAGVVSIALRSRKRARFVTLEGEVVGMNAGRSEADAGCWVPVVRFTAPDGREREIVGREFENPTPFHVQQRVPVLFDPNAPDAPWLAHDFAEATPIVHFVLAVVLGGVACVFLFVLAPR